MDVSSKSSILKVFNKLEKSNIYIDILINNAALNPKVEKENIHKNFTRLETFSLDSWNLEISIGLTELFYAVRFLEQQCQNHTRVAVF